ALTALALASLPMTVPELRAAAPSPGPVVQDTSRVRQDTAQARRPEGRAEQQPTVPDSLATDSLAD
ncbi:MAG: hypothetical protein GWN99_11620, partial [Gemmatimonadetes bacterium]|nr:hypothetical protein [Gemmatimonadota bacterium]NIV52622.1 hypothetical protein [Gammaproteobacteria bacterium]NIS01693.1 hypothetical protein [Gemmatimonadota bacterium]NIT67446.1 hypothetical protein [Gemmatimonadota bacterium]NIU53157.1 hypothetical protein [Gemmatimonadota bacterium]